MTYQKWLQVTELEIQKKRIRKARIDFMKKILSKIVDFLHFLFPTPPPTKNHNNCF